MWQRYHARPMSLDVLVWSDDAHARGLPAEAAAHHPYGIAATIRRGLACVLGQGVVTTAAALADDDEGLPSERLAAADVLVWWAHEGHAALSDAAAERVCEHVLGGLGLIVLHSGHNSKVFRRLMGTSCDLNWREGDDRELLWTVATAHPIAAGVPHPVELGPHEMYGEPFDIPAPDELVFVSSFTGGEVFRSGCCFVRGHGRIFFFSPGHETTGVLANEHVRRVIANAAVWARRPLARSEARRLGRPSSSAAGG